MRVAIYGRKITKLTLPAFSEILKTISAYGWGILLEEDLHKSLEQKGGVDYPCKLEYSKGTQHMIDMVFARGKFVLFG